MGAILGRTIGLLCLFCITVFAAACSASETAQEEPVTGICVEPTTGFPDGVGGVVEVGKSLAEDPAALPNIVLVMTDDQHWQSTDCMPILRTRLAPRATTFTNGFSTSPNCCPARAGFLTGDYVTSHGVYTNGLPRGGADAFAPDQTVTELLQDAGYRTGIFGKYLTNYGSDANGPPTGFDEYLVFDRTVVASAPVNPATQNYLGWVGTDNGEIVTFDSGANSYSTDVFGDRAIEFVASHDTNAPFFLQFSPFAPHRPATSAPRHTGLEAQVQRAVFPPNYGVVPEAQAWELGLSEAQWDNFRRADVENVRAQQIVALQAVDENLGRLLDQLEASGELNNTVVIFTSDNGFAWGEHRWLQKLCAYDACLRVPLLIADFRRTGGGSTDQRLVTNLDIAATLVELAGVDAGLLGEDAAPLDLQSSDSIRESFLIENYGAGNGAQPLGLPPFQGVRTSTHKYVRYADGAEELFDLVGDPWELQNVASVVEYRETLETLRAETVASFPRLLAQQNWEAVVADGCIGDGSPLTLETDVDLPALEDVLSFEVLLSVDSSLGDRERAGLDLVGSMAGWAAEEEIALPARPNSEGQLALPAKQVWVQRLQTTQITELEIEATVEPADKVCVDGPVTIRAHVLAPASGS